MSFFHTVLPLGLDVSLVGIAAFYVSRLRQPSSDNVFSIFGAKPGSKETDVKSEAVKCIAHRGAGYDAPENTLDAFKYCVEKDCKFVELDVRSTADGKLVLSHDKGLQRLSDSNIVDIHAVTWDKIKLIDVGVNHPNRHLYKETRLCLLDEALDYLLDNKVRVIIDVKGEDKQVINGIIKAYAQRRDLYKFAAVTCFNPVVLYQIRRKDPEIVGALSYRPYCFSAQNYDAENGPTNPRFPNNLVLQSTLQCLDMIHSWVWRTSARWCNVSAVLLHKDIVSPKELSYWHKQGIHCCGWCVNRPLEKLYWRGILRAPYLANTLLGEPLYNEQVDKEKSYKNGNSSERTDHSMENEKVINSGQN